MTPTRRRALLLLGLVLLAVPALAAFTERYVFEVPREREARLEGVFDLALGNVSIGEARRGQLFRAEVTLDEGELRPELVVEREDRTARVRLGFEQGEGRQGVSWRNVRGRRDNEWLLYFDRRTPLDLTFSLGVAEADLDFTGFRVERLRVSAGMAPTRLAFRAPNPVEMEHLQLEAGATRFRGEGLGHARFRRLSFSGGVGTFDLDLTGGPLPAGARADLDVGVSTLRLRLPEGRPVVLHAPDSWLTRVQIPEGYINRGRGRWHSAEVRDPERALQVHLSAGVGRVIIETGPPPR